MVENTNKQETKLDLSHLRKYTWETGKKQRSPKNLLSAISPHFPHDLEHM
jgi:hypothetical protein